MFPIPSQTLDRIARDEPRTEDQSSSIQRRQKLGDAEKEKNEEKKRELQRQITQAEAKGQSMLNVLKLWSKKESKRFLKGVRRYCGDAYGRCRGGRPAPAGRSGGDPAPR